MSTKTKESVITAETQGKHFEVDIRNIRPLQRAGGNIRSDYGDLTELAISIFYEGIIMPMRGYRVEDEGFSGYESFDGHRRLAAGNLLLKGFEAPDPNTGEKMLYKLDSVRAKVIIVRADRYSDEQIILDMITTNSGKPLNPVEISEAIRRLMVHGWNAKEIAAKFGKTVRYVQNLEILAGAPKRHREMVASGVISYTLLGDIFKKAADYNEAIAQIEAALGVAKTEKKTSGKDNDLGEHKEEEESDDLSGVHITKKHLDKAINRVDSSVELKLVFKRQIDNPKTVGNSELYTFAKLIIENKLTADGIEKLLFTPQN